MLHHFSLPSLKSLKEDGSSKCVTILNAIIEPNMLRTLSALEYVQDFSRLMTEHPLHR